MLKLSKRCKSLVALLLLCGCLVGFSSVSVSARTAYVTFSDLRTSKDFFTSDPLVMGNAAFSLADGVGYPTSGNMLNVEMTGYIVVSFINSNDYPVIINASRIQFDTLRVNFSTQVSSNSGDGVFTLTDVETLYGSTYPASFNGNSFSLRYDEYYMSGDYLIIPANTNLRSITKVVFSGQVFDSTNTGHVDVTSMSYNINLCDRYGIISTPTVSEYEGSILPKDSTDLGIYESIEDQIQQQQQQHEEQMEQSQQQYDDFTDSGSSDGSDLIAGTEEDIKDKIGIFTFLDNLIQRFLGLFVASDASTSITLPAFSMNIQGRDYQIWDEYTFDLSSLDGPFNALMTAVRFATVATVYFAFLGYLQNTYKRIIGGSNG